MPDGTSIEVIGAQQLETSLRAAAASLEDLREPSQAAGAMVVARARALAPKRTGALAGSIAATVDVGGVSVGASSPYAGVIHWGWPARNIKAQPFLSDAATSTEEQWVSRYEDKLNKAIEGVEGA